jgi:hypothetical protein
MKQRLKVNSVLEHGHAARPTSAGDATTSQFQVDSSFLNSAGRVKAKMIFNCQSAHTKLFRPSLAVP